MGDRRSAEYGAGAEYCRCNDTATRVQLYTAFIKLVKPPGEKDKDDHGTPLVLPWLDVLPWHQPANAYHGSVSRSNGLPLRRLSSLVWQSPMLATRRVTWTARKRIPSSLCSPNYWTTTRYRLKRRMWQETRGWATHVHTASRSGRPGSCG